MTSFTHYILDGTKVVAQYQTTTSSITPSNVIYFYYDESGSPTGMKYNGNVYYFQKNLQGDIIRILNTQGSIVATYTYDAWGNIIASTDTSGVSIGTKNPFRYRGYYYDTETGLYYLNSRYYDPQVGRFLNADGLVSTGQGLLGSNMFAYCGNNPTNFFDNTGTISRSILERESKTNFTPIPERLPDKQKSKNKYAILFDNRKSGKFIFGDGGFRRQGNDIAELLTCEGFSVDKYPYTNIEEFVNQWNSIDDEYDSIIIIGHGTAEQLHCNGQTIGVVDEDYLFSDLKTVKTNCVYLFACNGGTKGSHHTSTARIFAELTDAPVFAVAEGKVNFHLLTSEPYSATGGLRVIVYADRTIYLDLP